MMQTEHLTWMIGGGFVVAAVAFIMMRILWMPQGDRFDVSSMGSGRRPTQVTPSQRIRTKEDVVAFFRQETGDEELALLLADAAEKNGRDGYVEVRQGGSGTPYVAEYAHRSEDELRADRRTVAEVSGEINTLRSALKSAGADDERDRLERQIAWLAGGICTLWINAPSSTEYERLRTRIRSSVAAFKKVCAA